MIRNFKEWARRAWHRLWGSRPWSRGYSAARDRVFARGLGSLQEGKTFEPPQSYGAGMDERVVEYPWFFSRLPQGATELLDAGSTLNYEIILDRLELARRRLSICTLAPEANCFWQRGINYVYADFRELPFKDAHFDCVASISALEHVGMDNSLYTDAAAFKESARRDYLKAVSEFRRVLKPGGLLLITVPYGRPGNFGWFQQFDRGMLNELSGVMGPGELECDFYRYRRSGWEMAAQADCDEALYFDVHSGANPGSDHAAAARAVACLRLRKTEA